MLRVLRYLDLLSLHLVGDEGSDSDEDASEEEYEDEDGVKRTRKRRSKCQQQHNDRK